MKSITKRSLSVILVLMTVISIFGIVPITASAANPNQFTAEVNSPGYAPLDRYAYIHAKVYRLAKEHGHSHIQQVTK